MEYDRRLDSENAVERQQAEIEALRTALVASNSESSGEIERLRLKLAAMTASYEGQLRNTHAFQADLVEARTATAELRGALEAFKDCADTFDESTPDSFPLFSFNEDNEMEELEIELGDLRKARTALASSPPAGTDKDGLRKALGDTVIIDPGIRDGRPVLPGTGFMIADLLAEISDSAGVAEVADGFDLDAKRISNFLDALSGAINDALASSSTKE